MILVSNRGNTWTFPSQNYLVELLIKQHQLTQPLFADDYTTQLTKQAITAMKTGNKGRALQLMKRRCVADGVKHMYRQYRQMKWDQAHRLTVIVASTINPGISLPSRPQDNQMGQEEIQVEKFAQTMMVAQCNFRRNSWTTTWWNRETGQISCVELLHIHAIYIDVTKCLIIVCFQYEVLYILTL